MHQNLILDISFLPVEPPRDDKDIQSNAENMESQSCVSELSDSLEEESSVERTRAWVLDDQEEIEGQEFMDDDVLESEHSVHGGSVCDQNPSENEAVGSSDQVSGIETESSASNPDPQIETVNDSHANIIPDTQAQIPTDTQGVRTHAGRMVNRVSRLIESMAQKPFYGQKVGSTVARRSGSFLYLF